MVDFCCVSLVSYYLNDILCKNYNYTFVFVKVIPKTLLVPFFLDTVVFFLQACCLQKKDNWPDNEPFSQYRATLPHAQSITLLYAELDAECDQQVTSISRRWKHLATPTIVTRCLVVGTDVYDKLIAHMDSRLLSRQVQSTELYCPKVTRNVTVRYSAYDFLTHAHTQTQPFYGPL